MSNSDLIRKARARCKRQQPGNYDTMLFTEMADALERAEAKLAKAREARTLYARRIEALREALVDVTTLDGLRFNAEAPFDCVAADLIEQAITDAIAEATTAERERCLWLVSIIWLRTHLATVSRAEVRKMIDETIAAIRAGTP